MADASFPMIGSVCAVVVTYHPGPDTVDNLRAIVRECGRVVVVDNGSGPATLAALAGLSDVTVQALGSNVGLASALNRGFEYALELGCEWVVAFDQDSRPEPGFVDALWAMRSAHPTAAVIAPCIREAGGVDEHAYRWLCRHPRWPLAYTMVRCPAGGLANVTIAVTSGSMIELAEWRRHGGFDAGLFIDYIDIDFCLQVVRSGRRVAVASGATLCHRLGARAPRVLFGHDFRPMNHAPFRHYYMARNRVTVWRRHACAQPHWALFDFSFAVYNGFRAVVLEQHRWLKLKAMVLGTWDGLRGRSGPMPEARVRGLRT